ncbi:MAG: hypothetical protein H7Y19_00215 [Luteimonas sp.]|nr:hypothetical protein [Luteimonas sp.]
MNVAVRSHPAFRVARWPVLAAVMVIALAPVQAWPQTDTVERPAMPESNAMSHDAKQVSVESEGVSLEARFEYAASAGKLVVQYRVRNEGDAPIAIFDRGNRQAVLSKRQRSGAVPAPTFEDQGGATTLRHVALPLPRPAPTVPPTPLAAKVAAGAAVEGEFEFAFVSRMPKRVRWCLGIAPFADADLSAPEQAGSVEVWRASFAVVERQRVLCTPWFDLERGEFVGKL